MDYYIVFLLKCKISLANDSDHLGFIDLLCLILCLRLRLIGIISIKFFNNF